MPHEEIINYGTYAQMGLSALILVLFFVLNFKVRPVELNQFNFSKRLALSFSAMQGEENFFSKQGHLKLKTYRKLWVLFLILIASLIIVSLWLSGLQQPA